MKLTFRYKEKEYIVYDDFFSKWWWEEGNGACDCNRSDYIEKFYPDFQELDCGDEIELIQINEVI